MAIDVAITVANVLKGATSATTTGSGTAGGTITAGQPLYQLAADSRYYAADADASSATATVIGIALHASLAGQPIQFVTAGPMTIGGTLTIGSAYYLSITAGGINIGAPIAGYVSCLGFATSATVLTVNLNNTGVLL